MKKIIFVFLVFTALSCIRKIHSPDEKLEVYLEAIKKKDVNSAYSALSRGSRAVIHCFAIRRQLSNKKALDLLLPAVYPFRSFRVRKDKSFGPYENKVRYIIKYRGGAKKFDLVSNGMVWQVDLTDSLAARFEREFSPLPKYMIYYLVNLRLAFNKRDEGKYRRISRQSPPWTVKGNLSLPPEDQIENLKVLAWDIETDGEDSVFSVLVSYKYKSLGKRWFRVRTIRVRKKKNYYLGLDSQVFF